MNGIWETLLYPGECLSLYSKKQDKRIIDGGIVLRWRWKQTGGFDKFLERHFYDRELEEAFLTCLDIGEQSFSSYPKGIELFPEDRELVKSRNIFLSGGSLGLAFLLGMITFIYGKQWPNRVVAWGGLLPIRNNSFAVYAVDYIDHKIDLAKKIDASTIIHPESEKHLIIESIREIRITAPIVSAMCQLESVIKEKDM
jgi:hypothetical protein